MAYKDEIERIFRNEYARMLRLAAVIVHDPEAAKDMVHDIFAGLLQMRGRNEAAFVPSRAYLMAAVHNRCLRHLRGLEVRERFRNLYLFENKVDASEPALGAETFDVGELLSLLRSELPEISRRIFEMRFIENRKISEIAATMGIGERMVYKYLSQAAGVVRNKIRRI